MTIAIEFEYRKPKSIDKAVKLLSKYGARARVLAGGTDLVGWLRDDLIAPDALIDIKGLDELKAIKVKKNGLHIGSLVTFSELAESDLVRIKFPVIPEMIKTLACVGIRNRATMAGNICSAVPCCDSGPILLIYDAVLHLKGPAGKRKVAMGSWFLGPRQTGIHPGELVTAITIPFIAKKHAGCFVKQRRYKGEDLAQSSVAILALSGNEYRIAFGSVAPTPIRALVIEALLNGRKPTDAVISEAVGLVPQVIAPITDIRSTREYRTHMVKVMLERGLRAAASRLAGKGPEYGEELI